MNNDSLPSALMSHITGPIPSISSSLQKGAITGVISFAIFEGISLVDSNVPRVPVPWLLMLVVVIVEIVLYSRIAGYLRFPRTEDFFYIIRLSYSQRKEIAVRSFEDVQRAIVPFIIACAGISVLLEIFLAKERSIPTLAAVPSALILFTILFSKLGIFALKGNLIRVSSKDQRQSGGLNVLFHSTVFAKMQLSISKIVGNFTPHSIRPYVTRNVLYLLRSDPVLFPLFTLAAPVLLTLFLFMIVKPVSPFVEFFTVLTIFVLNSYFSSHFQESTDKISECPYYVFSPKTIVKAHFITASILFFPLIAVFILYVNRLLLTGPGLCRLLAFLLAVTGAILFGCKSAVKSSRKDSDVASDFALLTIASIGLFIPLFGWIFPGVVIGVTFLSRWESDL